MSKRRAEQLPIPNYVKRRRRVTSRVANADPAQENIRPDDLHDFEMESDHLPIESRAPSGSLNREATAMREKQSGADEVIGEGENASRPTRDVILKG